MALGEKVAELRGHAGGTLGVADEFLILLHEAVDLDLVVINVLSQVRGGTFEMVNELLGTGQDGGHQAMAFEEAEANHGNSSK